MKKITILATLAVLAIAAAGCQNDEVHDGWNDPVIPVTLKGIEAVHIDNAGEFPLVSASPVKKEAYVLGIRWIADNVPTEGDKYVTGPIYEGSQTYGSISDPYRKAIKCLTRFNAGIQAGTYVSKFFKEIDRRYLPAGVNEGYALLVAPDPGEHRFAVEYWSGNDLEFSYETSTVNMF